LNVKRALTLDEALDRAVLETGLDPIWRGNVAELLTRTSDSWRRCCGGACDPCTEQLGRAVDRVRALLEASEPR
jgi:hypothetical protein